MKRSSIYMTMLFLLRSVAVGAESIDPNQQVTFLGGFSNVRHTEEHQYGNEIDLWRSGEQVFGHFYHSEGLAGDASTGLLEDVKFNPKSGKLSFKSRLTTGQHYCAVHTNVPSHDIFEFEGELRNGTITGRLKHVEALDNNQEISDENVFFVKSKENQAPSRASLTYGEWSKQSKSILEFRGPKW